jgi:uncharacterized Fe-S cluster-containing radical SAM superfamily protein
VGLLQADPLGTRVFPLQPLDHLDALWVQVAGTVCNLTCTHCFVSAGPDNHRQPFMSRGQIAGRVAEALALGVREFYFTGGEPFLHPEMLEVVADTLPHGACTVLTNGTLFTPARLERLGDLARSSIHSLELRVSLDGWRAEDHERFRGAGSFVRTLEGIVAASRAGLLPIVTATFEPDQDPAPLAERYRTMLRAAGVQRPRLKLLPMFQLGRESGRTRAYRPLETLAGLAATDLEPGRLQCSRSRAVGAHGVYVCPLLVEEPGGRIGDRLDQALGPVRLDHGACFTCQLTGMTCANG